MKGLAFTSSSGNRYFYDDDSGLIFPASHCSGSPPYANRLPFRPLGDREPPPVQVDGDTIKRHHLGEAHGFRHLILEVTQQCNMRCKYCIFGEHYPFNRGYSDATMSVETALAAVDRFMGYHLQVGQRNPSARPIVGFYGGEPLLGFDVIKETVQHFHATYGQRSGDALFTLTTNGILLTDEVADFLVAHDFSIIVSLDGPQTDHDRNRVDAGGQGTFTRVFRNLQRLRARYPDFKRVAISACFDYRTDMRALRRFFDEHALFVVSISQADAGNTTYYAQFTDREKRQWAEMYEAFHAEYQAAAREGRIERGSFLFSYLGVSFAEFAFHPITLDRRPAFLPYTACCVPGEKLYVDVSGDLHMCERINPHFPIGTVQKGVNFERIAEIVAQYNAEVCTRCQDCPITRFCSRCFATSATDTGFALSEGSCARALDTVRETLVRYVDIVEYRPEILDDVTIDYHRNIMETVGYISV